MEFEKFNSIENAYNQKTINIADELFGNARYAVIEKIHGANFGVHLDCENNVVRFSRRSDFLAAGEKFHNYESMANGLERAIRGLGQMFWCHQNGSNVKSITMWGEIFGGKLEGFEKGVGCTTVQREVEYSPINEFALFAIQVDGVYQPAKVVAGAAQTVEVFHAPILGIAENLTDALSVDNDLPSLVSTRLGYTEKPNPDNIMEGVIIVPWDETLNLPNGKRVILKNKNENFMEKEKKVKLPPTPMDEQDEKVYQDIGTMICENRLSNVLSKELVEDLTGKDIPRIMGLLIQDACEDFTKECGVAPTDVCSSWKKVNNALSKAARELVLEWFRVNVL